MSNITVRIDGDRAQCVAYLYARHYRPDDPEGKEPYNMGGYYTFKFMRTPEGWKINSYKLNPTIFEVWMRLLSTVADSVLWLLGAGTSVEDNLRREAARHGVNPARLIFAPRVAYADYLARYGAADLFLDTLPFNGGTTASDALWAGLPVLTCAGDTFAGRMGASLLNAVGAP